MTTQDEINNVENATNEMDASAVGEIGRWARMRTAWETSVVGAVVLSLGLCCGALAYWVGEGFDLIYGDAFPFAPAFMFVSIGAVAGLSLVFANIKTKRPARIVRDLLFLIALLYTAFGLHCLAAYQCWGNGMSLAAALRGFFGRMSPFSFPVVFVAVVALAYRWFMENVRMAFAKRERPPELAWYVRKVAEFFSRHPSLAVSSPSEFFFLSVRCAVYGALLSLLILELMIVVWFAAHPPFCVDSFVGEKFWRVLSADVERKKLADPIGAIDELMLQSNGNPGRHLVCIYGHKYLGDASDEEADRLAEETSVALQRMLNVELKRYSPLGREGFRRGIYSRLAYAVVEWDDNFFQKEKVLRLEVGWDSIREYFVPGLTASEVLGYKIGVPVSGDGKPRKPFWKFESVVNQCGKNNIVDAVYAVHDVSDLSLEEATREFEEARKAVEGLHGITMFKMTDYDDVKRYDCEGEDVLLSVRMEYLRKKQIRYSVHAIGNWWHQIRKMNPGASRRRMRTRSGSREAFWLCISVFCGGLLLLVRKRRGRKCAV